MKKLEIGNLTKKALQSVLGFVGFFGLLSSKSVINQSMADEGNSNNVINNPSINTADSAALSNLLKFYWGRPNELTQGDLDQIEDSFGNIPSKQELELAMKKALSGMSTTKGIEIDPNGYHDFN